MFATNEINQIEMAFLSTELEHITQEFLEQLNNADIWTVNDLVMMDLMEIKKKTKIPYNKLKNIKDSAKDKYLLPCHSLNHWMEMTIQKSKLCPTGIPELTKALDDGYQTQEIVEFLGDTECGKTEMCYLLCGQILSHYEKFNILYVASSFDVNQERIATYTAQKANKVIDKDDMDSKYLKRVEIARPSKLSDLVHLLNQLVHCDVRNEVKCIIIDSLSFLIQEDLLNIKDGAEVYIHEVMRLLTNIAITKNVIVIITSSDNQSSFSRPWTNAVDHRIRLEKISDVSELFKRYPNSTIRKAVILKTIHNVSKIGFSVPFFIDDDGISTIR